MGLFSSSKSSSSSTTNTDARQNAFSEIDGTAVNNQGEATNNVTGDHALGVRGTNNTVSILDGGAIEQAFSFANKFSETQSGLTSGALRESIASVTEGARSETENIAVQIKTVAIYGLAAFAGVQIFKAMKK